jgi:hypothetical protein
MNKRLQNQLGLEQNLLGELLGDQVISDVALVGRDTFGREGAAMGILFQAVNTRILKNDLSQQRQRALDRAKDSRALSHRQRRPRLSRQLRRVSLRPPTASD